MRVFSCGHCGQNVYFENVVCENCGTALGFDPQDLDDASASIRTRPARSSRGGSDAARRSIAPTTPITSAIGWCRRGRQGGLCQSCDLNHTIPDLSVITGNVENWFEFEKAKRRLIYTLLQARSFQLTHDPDQDNPPPLSFDILADAMTGHDNGRITLNVAEADPATRERRPHRDGRTLPHRCSAISGTRAAIIIGRSSVEQQPPSRPLPPAVRR